MTPIIETPKVEASKKTAKLVEKMKPVEVVKSVETEDPLYSEKDEFGFDKDPEVAKAKLMKALGYDYTPKKESKAEKPERVSKSKAQQEKAKDTARQKETLKEVAATDTVRIMPEELKAFGKTDEEWAQEIKEAAKDFKKHAADISRQIPVFDPNFIIPQSTESSNNGRSVVMGADGNPARNIDSGTKEAVAAPSTRRPVNEKAKSDSESEMDYTIKQGKITHSEEEPLTPIIETPKVEAPKVTAKLVEKMKLVEVAKSVETEDPLYSEKDEFGFDKDPNVALDRLLAATGGKRKKNAKPIEVKTKTTPAAKGKNKGIDTDLPKKEVYPVHTNEEELNPNKFSREGMSDDDIDAEIEKQKAKLKKALKDFMHRHR